MKQAGHTSRAGTHRKGGKYGNGTNKTTFIEPAVPDSQLGAFCTDASKHLLEAADALEAQGVAHKAYAGQEARTITRFFDAVNAAYQSGEIVLSPAARKEFGGSTSGNVQAYLDELRERAQGHAKRVDDMRARLGSMFDALVDRTTRHASEIAAQGEMTKPDRNQIRSLLGLQKNETGQLAAAVGGAEQETQTLHVMQRIVRLALEDGSSRMFDVVGERSGDATAWAKFGEKHGLHAASHIGSQVIFNGISESYEGHSAALKARNTAVTHAKSTVTKLLSKLDGRHIVHQPRLQLF